MPAPPTNDTRLDAVNAILGNAGYAIATSLSAGAPGHVLLADRELEKRNKEVQAMGWWFNLQENYVFKPNSDDRIVIPGNVVRVDDFGDDFIARWDGTSPRQKLLYSKRAQSFEFTSDTSVAQVMFLFDFVEIEHEAQELIINLASLHFQMTRVGDRGIHAINQEAVNRSRAALMQREAEMTDSNILNNTSLREHRRRGIGRYRG